MKVLDSTSQSDFILPKDYPEQGTINTPSPEGSEDFDALMNRQSEDSSFPTNSLLSQCSGQACTLPKLQTSDPNSQKSGDSLQMVSSDENNSFLSSTEYKTHTSSKEKNVHSRHEEKTVSAHNSPSPHSLLESLFSQNMMSHPPKVEANPQVTATPNSNPVIEELVDRILVAEPKGGKQEVSITLGEGVLKGSEINISRDITGNLVVALKCKNESAFQTAVSAHRDLVDALKSHETEVKVVVDRDMGEGNEGDSRRRSRGLQDIDAGQLN